MWKLSHDLKKKYFDTDEAFEEMLQEAIHKLKPCVVFHHSTLVSTLVLHVVIHSYPHLS